MHRLHARSTDWCMHASKQHHFFYTRMAHVVKNNTIAIIMSTTKQPDSNTKEKDAEEQGKQWSSQFTTATGSSQNLTWIWICWTGQDGQDRMKIKIYCWSRFHFCTLAVLFYQQDVYGKHFWMRHFWGKSNILRRGWMLSNLKFSYKTPSCEVKVPTFIY